MTVPIAVQGLLAGRRYPAVAFALRSATGYAATANEFECHPLDTLDRGLRHAWRFMLPRNFGEALISFPLFPMANTPSTAKRPAEQQDATSSAQPVATVRYGDVSAAIFADVVRLPTGVEFTTHRVSLRRSYRDQQANEWKHTNSLGDADLLPAAEALRKCFEIIEERRKS